MSNLGMDVLRLPAVLSDNVTVRLSDGHAGDNKMRDGEPALARGRHGFRVGNFIPAGITNREPVDMHDNSERHLHWYFGPLKVWDRMTGEECAAQAKTTDIGGPKKDMSLYYISAIRDELTHELCPMLSAQWYSKLQGDLPYHLPEDYRIQHFEFGARKMHSSIHAKPLNNPAIVGFNVRFQEGDSIARIFKVNFYAPNGWYADGTHGVHAGFIDAESQEVKDNVDHVCRYSLNGGYHDFRKAPEECMYLDGVQLWNEYGEPTENLIKKIKGL